MSNSCQNLNLSFNSPGTVSTAIAIIIHNGDLFPFKCKREAEDEGQTFPEVLIAHLKS